MIPAWAAHIIAALWLALALSAAWTVGAAWLERRRRRRRRDEL